MGLARDPIATYRATREWLLARQSLAAHRESLQLALSAVLAVGALLAFRGLGECVGVVMGSGMLPFGETFPQAGVVCVTQRGQFGGTLLGAALVAGTWWALVFD